ncbi:hypothetical protein PFISCL1PPCAC_14726, partial [Pristionchus fissidentatus]
STEEMGGKSRQCLICGVQTANSHMGIDSCRACAVFYKRTLTGTRPLKCKQGGGNCLLTDPTTSCRKCRFERFHGIIQRAYGANRQPPPVIEDYPMCEVTEPVDAYPEEEMKEVDIKPIIASTSRNIPILDHSSYFTIESSSSSLLERIRRAYSTFCLVRKTGELSMKPRSPTQTCNPPSLERDELKYYPARYSNMMKTGRLYIESLFDFAYAAFDDYREMETEVKQNCIRNCFHLIGSVSSAYRAAHHFPNDDTVFVTYLSTLNVETAADFFDESPSETNKEDAIRTLRDNITMGNRLKKDNFRRVQPTEDEFLALLGLAFWSTDIDSPCDTLNRLAILNRERIMREMHQSYWRNGQTDYASRIGELFCLLVTLQKSVSMLAEEIQVFRLLDVFDESIFKKKCHGCQLHD